jgi:hypothetical protein
MCLQGAGVVWNEKRKKKREKMKKEEKEIDIG